MKELRRSAFLLAEIAYEEALPKLDIERATLRENEIKAEEAKRKAQEGERRVRRA